MRPNAKGINASRELTPRSYPSAMLLPLFPEPTGSREYKTSLDGVDFRIFVEGDDGTLATPSDRRLMSIIAAALARQIQSNITSRHLHIETRELMNALNPLEEKSRYGGENYARLREKLTRLMATVIETSQPVSTSKRRNSRFRWIDSFQYEGVDENISGQTTSVRITLSEEAFFMMASELGFNTPQEAFLSIASNSSSTWRIYEICLATVLRNNGQATRVSIEDLHHRIPLQCPLKVFKSRALKKALEKISEQPEMAGRIRLSLERKTETGFEEISFSKRVSPNQVFVSIRPINISDIVTDRLLDEAQTPSPKELTMMV
jgi:hypothetical protein